MAAVDAVYVPAKKGLLRSSTLKKYVRVLIPDCCSSSSSPTTKYLWSSVSQPWCVYADPLYPSVVIKLASVGSVTSTMVTVFSLQAKAISLPWYCASGPM